MLDELESLKPEFQRQVNELNKAHTVSQQQQIDVLERTPYDSEISSQWPPVNKKPFPSFDNKQVRTKQISY